MEVITVPHKPDNLEKPEPTITVIEPPKIGTESPPAQMHIRCIYDSRLIVRANQTPSGMRYEFMTGEVRPVLFEDYQFLLSLESRAPGCCGGYGGSQSNRRNYFEALEV